MANLSINVVLIASLQEQGCNAPLSIEAGSSVRDTVAKFCNTQGINLDMLLGEVQLVSLNHQRVQLDHAITENGELALMPPITGG